MQMGDGRVDSKQLVEAAGDRSRLHILFDMEDIARDVGAHISAVLLDVHEILGQGVRRLIDFQDVAYAGCFLDRLVTFSDKDTNLFKKTAKHLAVRMSFEDVIKVAQAKTRATRMRRIKAESGASPGDTLVVTEFLKPGINEFCDVLPEGLARWLLAKAARWPRLQNWQRGMELNSSSVSGYTKLKLLAGMRRWRRRTWRFRREQETIETWLNTISQAAILNNALAMEVAEWLIPRELRFAKRCSHLKNYFQKHPKDASIARRAYCVCSLVLRKRISGHSLPALSKCHALRAMNTGTLS